MQGASSLCWIGGKPSNFTSIVKKENMFLAFFLNLEHIINLLELKKMKATYNVDWVECYCIEQDFFGTPDYYRNLGYIVKEHDYGTRMYKQVFDVFAPNNRPLYHITRDPYSVRGRERGAYSLSVPVISKYKITCCIMTTGA